MPPEAEFTEHYRQHYQLGSEEPIEVSGCELPPLAPDDTLSRADFDAGLRCLNENDRLDMMTVLQNICQIGCLCC